MSILLMDEVAGIRALKKMTLDSRLEECCRPYGLEVAGHSREVGVHSFGKRIKLAERIYKMKGSRPINKCRKHY